MMKRNIYLAGLAMSLGLISCGGSNSESNTNSISDSSATNVQMLDSGVNSAPAQGMGDSTLYRDSNSTGGSATGSANDSVRRNGGSSTSSGNAGGGDTGTSGKSGRKGGR